MYLNSEIWFCPYCGGIVCYNDAPDKSELFELHKKNCKNYELFKINKQKREEDDNNTPKKRKRRKSI